MARSQYAGELRQDVAYAFRSLRVRPGFALVVILTLGLGIGANSAIFSVVNAVLLKGLPWANGSELVLVQSDYANGEQYPLSAPDFASLAEWNRVYDDIAAFAQTRSTLTGVGEPTELRGALATEGLHDMIGAQVVLGRPLQPADHAPGAPDVVLLSHGLWQRLFGGDPSVLGRTLTLSGQPYEVAGVLAPGREMPEDGEVFGALTRDSTFSATTTSPARRGEFLNVVARVGAGVTMAAAHAEMQRLGSQMQEQFPATNARITFSATPLTQVMLGDVRMPLLVLLGAVALVLLVACANVANLLLARATSRGGELAVRAALGAGRGRLVRQLLTESVVLAMIGGALGLLLAFWGTRALVAAQPADIPQFERIRVDGAVIAFTGAVTLLTALLFGALPALQATGARLMQTLRASGRGGAGGGQRLRSGLRRRGARARGGAARGRGAADPQPVRADARRSGVPPGGHVFHPCCAAGAPLRRAGNAVDRVRPAHAAAGCAAGRVERRCDDQPARDGQCVAVRLRDSRRAATRPRRGRGLAGDLVRALR